MRATIDRIGLIAVLAAALLPGQTGTPKTTAELMQYFRDGQPRNSITPARMRDLVASIPQVYNVKGYGADGNGVSDDAGEIQAAIDAAEAAGGGIVVFPKGDYAIGTTLTVTGNNVQLLGGGREGTILRATTSPFNILRVTTSVGYSNLTVRDLSFYGGDTLNAGDAIILDPLTSGCHFENIEFQNYTRGFYADRIAKSTFTDITLAGTNTALGYFGSSIDGASGYTRAIHIDGVYAQLNSTFTTTTQAWIQFDRVVDSSIQKVELTTPPIGNGNEIGILLTNGTEGIRISNVIILGVGYGIWMAETTVGSTTVAPRWVHINNAQIDSFDLEGITCDQCQHVIISNSLISAADAAADACRGVYLIPSGALDDDIIIANNVFQNWHNNGVGCAAIWVSAGEQYVNINGNTFTGTTGTMLHLDTGATDYFNITGNNFALVNPAASIVNNATGTNFSIQGNTPAINNVHSYPIETAATYIRIRTDATPASAGAACNKGTIAWDASFLYVCTATNTWKRSAISTW